MSNGKPTSESLSEQATTARDAGTAHEAEATALDTASDAAKTSEVADAEAAEAGTKD